MLLVDLYIGKALSEALKTVNVHGNRLIVISSAKKLKEFAIKEKLTGRPTEDFIFAAQRHFKNKPTILRLVKKLAKVCNLHYTCFPADNYHDAILPAAQDAEAVISKLSIPILSCPLPHLIVWVLVLYKRTSNVQNISRYNSIKYSLSALYMHSAMQGKILFKKELLDEWEHWIESQSSKGIITPDSKKLKLHAVSIISKFAFTGKLARRQTYLDTDFRVIQYEIYQIVKRALTNISSTPKNKYLSLITTASKRLLKYAELNHFTYLDNNSLQQFLNEEQVNGKNNKLFWDCVLLKEIDRMLSLTLVNPNTGLLLNEEKFFNKEPQSDLNSRPSIQITSLIERARDIIQKIGLSELVFKSYISIWRLLLGYVIPRYGDIYSQKALQDFLSERTKNHSKPYFREYRRAVLILVDIAETSNFRWKVFPFKTNSIPAPMQKIMQEFIYTLQTKRLTDTSIKSYSYTIKKFFSITEIKTLDRLYELNEDDVSRVSNQIRKDLSKASVYSKLPILRKWYKWLHNSGYIRKDYSLLVVKSRCLKTGVVPYLSESDEIKLRTFIPKLSSRNRAIILLALDLGIRGIDIYNLRISNIDWKQEQLSIIQQKTGNKVVYPLLEDIGNALFEYLSHDRPKDAESDYVFVRTLPPHVHLVSKVKIIGNVLKKLGIKPENGHRLGSHTLRYTFTRRLLSSRNFAAQEITDALGHISSSSDRYYRSIDDDKLRQCALDLSEIGSFCWKE